MAPKGQAGVARRNSIHGLVLLCRMQPAQLAALRLKVAKLPALAQSLDERFSESLLNVTVGFSQAVFRMLGGLMPPQDLDSLPDFSNTSHGLILEPIDMVFTIRSERFDSCFFAGRVLSEWFADDIHIVQDFTTFHYLDNRSLYGFKCWRDTLLGESRERLVRIDAAHEPAWHLGSYLVVQQQAIDETRWQKLRLEQQEQLLGRRKLNGEPVITDTPNHHSKIRDRLGSSVLWHQLPVASMEHQSHIELTWGNNFESLIEFLRSRIEDDEDGFCDPMLEFEENQLTAAFFVPPLVWFESLKELD